MSLKREAKRYALDQSPLYRIKGFGQLERLLDLNLEQLPRLLAPENYRVWTNERGREIQQPIRWMGQIHARLAKLFGRIAVPDYVYSKRGRSSVENAKYHRGTVPLAKTDVHRFYPSTTRQMVWRMLVTQFKCAEDVAHRLADICCYRQEHLPTGSPISGYVAYLASKRMFDEIHQVAVAHGFRMSVYVDDVTISGVGVNKRSISLVRRIIHRSGLTAKRSKTKTFPANAIKVVTGAAIDGNNLLVPNLQLKRIWETRRALRTAAAEEKKSLVKALDGRLQHAKQITRTGDS